jgi:hypothetical protein
MTSSAKKTDKPLTRKTTPVPTTNKGEDEWYYYLFTNVNGKAKYLYKIHRETKEIMDFSTSSKEWSKSFGTLEEITPEEATLLILTLDGVG